MASAVHCISCFEALDAELSSRQALSLNEITASWALYTASKADKLLAQNPRLHHVTDGGDSSSGSSSSTSLAPSTAPTSAASPTQDLASTPLFVTWNTVESDNEAREDDEEEEVSLRGCIGTFEALPLSTGLPEYALISALQDTRFSPITRRELPTLQAAVTLLTDFEPVEDPFDWEVGTHGIRLAFTDRSRRYGSTYLPDVAAEQGWTKDEAMYSLIRKAGWTGSRSKWRELDLKVTRYQGKKASMLYGEYKKWRDWVDKK